MDFKSTGFTGFLDICIKLKKLHITAKSRGLACRAAGEPLNWGGLVNHGQTMKTPPEPLKTLGGKDVTGLRTAGSSACLCQTTASGNQRFSLRTATQPKCLRILPTAPTRPGELPSRGIPELLTTRHKSTSPMPVLRAHNWRKMTRCYESGCARSSSETAGS